MTEARGLAARIVAVFLQGNLTPLLILLSLALGVVALRVTPREEEPQIVVPLADVIVDVPGASAEEVASLVTTRLERMLWQIDGVEYVYSTSMPNRAVVTVRFFVGRDREKSLLLLHNKLAMGQDAIPPQVAQWVVKPIEVDDVPIVDITLWSHAADDFELRRLAEELEHVVQSVPQAGPTQIVGGRSRQLSITIDPQELAAHRVTAENVINALHDAAVALPAGAGDRLDRRIVVQTSGVAPAAADLEQLVIATTAGRQVRIADVATVRDGPAERATYSRISFGPAATDVPAALRDPELDHPAVTLAVAKRRGSNAVTVADAVREKVTAAAAELLPDGVFFRITRDQGKVADQKVDELLEGLWVAIIIVIALIAMSLGMREALVVATAVPITFALTLFVNWLCGYSINRVTLFALTLALGLVVDDPIVDVENIHRHLRAGRRKPLEAVLVAVNEVRPPIILATMAVIVSFMPLFGITGMMGPYMSPMALNVPLAMLMSLLVAFAVTPWLSWLALRNHVHAEPGAHTLDDDHSAVRRSLVYRFYGATMRPLLTRRGPQLLLLGITAVLFAGSCWLGLARAVPLKMLPFDNKNELQVVVDLPEGSSLERTEAVLAEMAETTRAAAEVVDVTTFAGSASPIDFNGMVRHYQLRQLPHQGDLRVNLIGKRKRAAGSHEFGMRLREWLLPIAQRNDAKLAIVEQPPGPPVIATLAVEVRTDPAVDPQRGREAALTLAARLQREPGVADVDTTVEATQAALDFHLDRQKAALHGVTDAAVANMLASVVGGQVAATLHADRERQPLQARVRLPRADRAEPTILEHLPIQAADGHVVPLGELGTFDDAVVDPAIWHKNLQRVDYVFAEVVGRAPAEVIFDVQADRDREVSGVKVTPIPVEQRNYLRAGGGVPWHVPDGVSLDWTGEGEWKITIDAFRDLGLAFLAACFGIYILLVYENKSYFLPLILMLSIPFTIIGIMPGFWLLDLLSSTTVAGARTPVFFTATAMIGMIALSGIAVRNAILLIEFVRKAEGEGLPLDEAIVQAGAIRLRPIFLTAGAALLAAIPITLDPIFSGLAWALIFGLVVSSVFTLVLVPMIYAMVYGKKQAAAATPTPPTSG